ncbi:hypothetical protein L4D04_08480 [Photobacterium angustum]|uniref:Glutamyl-tRNA synthetase n=1 Tax=Photobacterium angustum (strain S14 / CCUG 15956) TaxID=314292 RepID=Q1ZPJ9_PHOAS|nr:hypothetical protein [Photobacterium angustum]EAS63961.1 glutamyl-tRNA synthetase [Photobacterium angustum S14]
MKKLLITCGLTVLLGIASSTVYASGTNGHNGMGGAGGYGQTACVLPNSDLVFVPWFVCKAKSGKTNDF